jgi:hypothetical protein
MVNEDIIQTPEWKDLNFALDIFAKAGYGRQRRARLQAIDRGAGNQRQDANGQPGARR